VVGIRGRGCVTDATRQLLDPPYVLPLFHRQFIVHLLLSYFF
jgi:hypothetical protein